MLLSRTVALAWALLTSGLCQAQSNTTEWPLHNDGLNSVVEWYEHLSVRQRGIQIDLSRAVLTESAADFGVQGPLQL